MPVRFVIVGAAVALAALLFREALAALLPPTRLSYGFTIVVTYALGILAAFELHRRWTFSARRQSSLLGYALTSIAGGLATTAFADTLRYRFIWPQALEIYADSIAFALALGAVSVVSFVINERLVFRRSEH